MCGHEDDAGGPHIKLTSQKPINHSPWDVIVTYRKCDPIREQKNKWYQETGDGQGADDRSLAFVGCRHDERSLTRGSSLGKDLLDLAR